MRTKARASRAQQKTGPIEPNLNTALKMFLCLEANLKKDHRGSRETRNQTALPRASARGSGARGGRLWRHHHRRRRRWRSRGLRLLGESDENPGLPAPGLRRLPNMGLSFLGCPKKGLAEKKPKGNQPGFRYFVRHENTYTPC